MHRARIFGSLVATLVIVVVFAGCDDVVKDATFRMWCGEGLCAWTTEAGSIRRAPTWHKKDYGVELVSVPTVISQTVTDKTPKCLEFSTIADVETKAQVSIGLDFNADGTIDYEQPIAATGWRETKTLVTAPLRYDGIRFVIAKKGEGRAVLAQMRVQSRTECSGPPVVLENLPLGSPCAVGGDGAECVSGICCVGLCAECCAQTNDAGDIWNVIEPCAEGGACDRRDVLNVDRSLFPTVPLQCDPGGATHPPGSECLADDDCASGACEGAVSFARRAAPGGDGGWEACDGGFPDAGQSDCVFGRVRGGRCR